MSPISPFARGSVDSKFGTSRVFRAVSVIGGLFGRGDGRQVHRLVRTVHAHSFSLRCSLSRLEKRRQGLTRRVGRIIGRFQRAALLRRTGCRCFKAVLSAVGTFLVITSRRKGIR